MAPPDRWVVLDRDGVINEDSDDYVRSPSQWVPLPGSLEAIARLTGAGWHTAVVTNQSGVARGYLSLATLAEIHGRMRAAIEANGGRLDGIFVCPHHPDDRCECRKPRVGLLREVERRRGRPLTDVPMIGDKQSDLDAARAVGARPILVRTGKGRDTEAALAGRDIEIYDDLLAAVTALLAEADA